ncbi:MAG: PC4/YdbC family ssDNA-binding protein [Isosphaeraceae bacterium]
MTTSSDLRDRAERLREQLPPRQSATPPAENGRRVGTIERSATEEIRVNWSEYEGKPFISIRMWKRSDDGAWWPDKRGIAIRVRELPALAAAIAEALDIAEADVRQWREQQARRPAAPMPGRRIDPATLPPTPLPGQGELFDEFAEQRQ